MNHESVSNTLSPNPAPRPLSTGHCSQAPVPCLKAPIHWLQPSGPCLGAPVPCLQALFFGSCPQAPAP